MSHHENIGGANPCSPTGNYVNNEMNRRLKRVGLPYGSHPVTPRGKPSPHKRRRSCSPTGKYSSKVWGNRDRSGQGYHDVRSLKKTGQWSEAKSALAKGATRRTTRARSPKSSPKQQKRQQQLSQKQAVVEQQVEQQTEKKTKDYSKRLGKLKADLQTLQGLEGKQLSHAMKCIGANAAGSREKREKACRALPAKYNCAFENKRCKYSSTK